MSNSWKNDLLDQLLEQAVKYKDAKERTATQPLYLWALSKYAAGEWDFGTDEDRRGRKGYG